MKTPPLAAALLLAACQPEGGGNVAAPAADDSAPSAKKGAATLDLQQALGRSHKALARAVEAAGLAKTLSGAQPYTLFAPTDAAIAKRPGGADALLAPEAKGRLVAILTGHIVPGTVTADDLGKAIDRGKGKARLATVGGGDLIFAREGGAIVVTDAAGGRAVVTGPEVPASNGVIHSIDGVLGGK